VDFGEIPRSLRLGIGHLLGFPTFENSPGDTNIIVCSIVVRRTKSERPGIQEMGESQVFDASAVMRRPLTHSVAFGFVRLWLGMDLE
jgi:hypothetical protein